MALNKWFPIGLGVLIVLASTSLIWKGFGLGIIILAFIIGDIGRKTKKVKFNQYSKSMKVR